MVKTRRFAILFFFFTAASYITGSLAVGPISGKFVSMLCLAYLLWRSASLNIRNIAIRLTVYAASVLMVSRGDVLLSLSSLILVCLCAAFLEVEQQRQSDLFTYALAAMLMYVGFFFAFFTEPGLKAFDVLSEALSAAGGGLIGRVIHVGPSYTGCGQLLIVICYLTALAVFRGKERRIRVRVLLALPWAAFLSIAYVSVWSLLSETQFYDVISRLEPLVQPFDYRLLQFILLLIPVGFASWPQCVGYEADRSERPSSVPVCAVAAFAALLIAASALHGTYTGFPAAQKKGAVIALYSSQDSPVMLSKPEAGSYGLENAGMFGMLPEYLQANGYKFIIIDHIDSESLKGCDVLMIVNLLAKLPRESEESVWSFVSQGHSLLLLGDHTGGEQIREPSNELLAPVNISFNFDSAIPFRDLWNQSFDTPWHPVYSGLTGSEYQINIGASLCVAYPARSVVLGRNGFSDAGDTGNMQNGFLGDMQFARGERLGDLTLVAEAPYGAGKIWVSGDTSFVQTLNLPYSYRYVSKLFRWLSSSARPQQVWMDIVVVALLLASACVILLCANNRTALIMLAGTVIASALLVNVLPGSVGDDPYGGSKIAVDRAAGNFLQTNRDKNSIDGLMANIERNDYHPYLINDDSVLFGGGYRAIVEIAPSTPMSASKINNLTDYMDGGGIVVLTAGWREAAACGSFLKQFGLAIGDMPLGRGETDRAGKAANPWEAWPVEIDAATEGSVQILAEEWDYPVAVWRPIGQGGLVLICDAQFFSNKNLEDKYTFSKVNIDFIGSIVSRLIN